MDSLWNTEAFTSTRNNPRTGQAERKWIEYADGVFEPVRKNGNLNKKFHGNKRELDWWTVEKPLDWDPAKEGRDISLNHDYSRMNKPGKKAEPVLFAAAGKKEAEEDKAAPKQPEASVKPEQTGGVKQPTPKTTLLRGADAYHEFEAERQAEKDAKAGESPQPTPGDPGKLAGADAASPPEAKGGDGKSDSAVAGAGAAGGMVQSKQQYGQGKASGNDQRINDFQREYEAADAEQKGNLKNEFKKEIDELKAKANKANGKERKKLLRRAEQWRGALKVITDGKVRSTGPLMLFNVPLMEKMMKNPFSNPEFPDET